MLLPRSRHALHHHHLLLLLLLVYLHHLCFSLIQSHL
jgi:hypothetical protein